MIKLDIARVILINPNYYLNRLDESNRIFMYLFSICQ
jgi:hypothetical protein